MANENRKARSPYQKYGKTPFKYSDLRGVAFQRMLIQRFGAGYWIRVGTTGPLRDQNGKTIPMFPREAYPHPSHA